MPMSLPYIYKFYKYYKLTFVSAVNKKTTATVKKHLSKVVMREVEVKSASSLLAFKFIGFESLLFSIRNFHKFYKFKDFKI